MKSWNSKQIKDHTLAAEKLGLIKNEFANFLKQNPEIDESKSLLFIKNAYKRHGLTNDDKNEFAIVAFGVHTNEVHYFPNRKTNAKLEPNTLILLDIWARLDKKDAPYADATFMFYKGKKVPTNINKTWSILSSSRDKAIDYIQNEIKKDTLPRGLDIDRAAHDHIGCEKLGHGIKHTIGHSLGFNSPHGKLPGINWREYRRILKNVGYTIEPGIYLKDFGMRTEIDFYINQKNEVIITTLVQEYIDLI